MTDNEIIKALECCNRPANQTSCDVCPYQFSTKKCSSLMIKDAIDLITRQKAENSNLTSHLTSLQNDLTSAKAEIDRLKCGCKKLVKKQELYKENMQATREWQIEQAKTEAIKEFAERLKGTAYTHSDITGYQTTVVDVLNYLVKEMVGDKE